MRGYSPLHYQSNHYQCHCTVDPVVCQSPATKVLYKYKSPTCYFTNRCTAAEIHIFYNVIK